MCGIPEDVKTLEDKVAAAKNNDIGNGYFAPDLGEGNEELD